jgi:hypothetical protein
MFSGSLGADKNVHCFCAVGGRWVYMMRWSDFVGSRYWGGYMSGWPVM